MRSWKWIVGSALLALCVLLPSRVALAQQAADVPYVPTPWNVVDSLLEVALVRPDDFVIDLGSGDGRIVIQAAKKLGARGMGVELDPNLVRAANEEAGRQGVAGKVSFVSGNLFNLDLSRATVLTLYLLPQINVQLRPRILSQLRPGTRVVSHDFGMDEWKPDQHREIAVPDKPYGRPVSQVYLWYVPANVAGKWRWRLTVGGEPRAYEARINQLFQELSGEVLVDGSSAVTRNLKLRGDRISFTLLRDSGGQQIVHEFSGRVDGDTAGGLVTVAGGGANATLDWLATRVERGTLRTQ